jgi:hypothetical protein
VSLEYTWALTPDAVAAWDKDRQSESLSGNEDRQAAPPNTALTGFEINSLAKILGGLDGSGVGRRIRSADGEALLVKLGFA